MTPLARYGGRRFVLTVGAGIVYVVMRWFDKIDIAGFVTLQVATVGAYLTVNTLQKIKAKSQEEADA